MGCGGAGQDEVGRERAKWGGIGWAWCGRWQDGTGSNGVVWDRSRSKWDGVRWEEMGWNEKGKTGWDRVSWNGLGWDLVDWDAI